MYVGDIVFVSTIGAVIVGILIMNCVPRFRAWRTLRWVTREIGDSTPELIIRLNRVLSARRRRISLGALAGFGLSLAVALPTWDQMTAWSSMTSVAATGAVLGMITAAALSAARDAAIATPPDGVRVALSARPQAAWFTSRVVLSIFGLAAVIQIWAGYLRIAEAWPYDGPTVSTVTAIVAMVVLVLVGVATLTFLPWLVGRPFYATDELGLRAELALRRDHLHLIIGLQFSLIIDIGLLIGTVDWTNVPIEVRREHSGLITAMSVTALLLLVVGNLIFVLVSRKPVRQLPQPQVSLRSSRTSLR